MLYFIVFMWAAQYWEIILHRSLTFLHVLGAEALTAFVPDYLFKDVCIAMGLGRQRCVVSHWSRVQVYLLSSVIKRISSSWQRLGFLSSEVFSCETKPLCVDGISLDGSILFGSGVQGKLIEI